MSNLREILTDHTGKLSAKRVAGLSAAFSLCAAINIAAYKGTEIATLAYCVTAVVISTLVTILAELIIKAVVKIKCGKEPADEKV